MGVGREVLCEIEAVEQFLRKSVVDLQLVLSMWKLKSPRRMTEVIWQRAGSKNDGSQREWWGLAWGAGR